MRVYVKGSYKNNTNVRSDADVDVCVEWTDFFYVGTVESYWDGRRPAGVFALDEPDDAKRVPSPGRAGALAAA